MKDDFRIIAGRSHPAFAQAVASALGVPLTRVAIGEYPNDNLYVRILESVRGKDVFVIQTSCPPVQQNLVELLMLVDALRYASVARVTVVLPYYPYVRSDKKDEPRISVAARLVAVLLEAAGADRILTANLHAMQTMAFARIPVDQLDGIPVLSQALQSMDLQSFLAVAPDIGRARVTESYARWLNLPVAVVDKRRDPATGHVTVRRIIGDVADRDVLLIDDEVLTGSSLLAAIEAIRALPGARSRRIIAACVHAPLARGAFARLRDAGLEKLVTTDTVPLAHREEGIEVYSLAPLFAKAIQAIREGASMSDLFPKPGA